MNWSGLVSCRDTHLYNMTNLNVICQVHVSETSASGDPATQSSAVRTHDNKNINPNLYRIYCNCIQWNITSSLNTNNDKHFSTMKQKANKTGRNKQFKNQYTVCLKKQNLSLYNIITGSDGCVTLKMICNDFLVVKVNCLSSVFNIMKSILLLRNVKNTTVLEKKAS